MTERRNRLTGRWTGAGILLMLLLLLCAPAGAEERHSVLLEMRGGGFAGTDERGYRTDLLLAAGTARGPGDGERMDLEALLGLEGFRLEGAALRFTAEKVNGDELKYTLVCGKHKAPGQRVLPGRNLWDVTDIIRDWLMNPEEALYLSPAYIHGPWGMQVKEGSVSLLLTFTSAEKLKPFPLDRVRYNEMFEAGLAMLEEGNPFLARYDDTADSLLQASLPLGVPYYYAGGTEDKFLRRFYPSTTTHYYLDTHMYLCGLDCVGFTHLVYEKCGIPRHPSINTILFRGIGHDALANNDPARWPMMLLPGDLVGVEHGTFHILMYLGTMRTFGWTEHTAGEALPLLDAPLFIHCGGDPFYHERYRQYIRDMGYKNTWPPDGGVTVSAAQVTNREAPHQTDTSWGKHFGWYTADGHPLLVFPLDDCTDIAWYSPE